MAKIAERETKQIDEANASGRPPAVFIHGLWLLSSSWERWATLFEEAGYAALTPSWPDDPETVDEARANPEVFAKKTVGQVGLSIARAPANAGTALRRCSEMDAAVKDWSGFRAVDAGVGRPARRQRRLSL